MNEIKGFVYIGTLTDKYITTYKDKDNKEREQKNIKFEYMGGYNTFRVSDALYNTLELDKQYCIPVGFNSKKDWDFVNSYVREKTEKIYEIQEDNSFIEISLS